MNFDFMIDHRSYTHNLKKLKTEKLTVQLADWTVVFPKKKKIQAWTRFEPMTSA